ncbi:3TM-type holin [Pseudoalteromonas xiamenensis]
MSCTVQDATPCLLGNVLDNLFTSDEETLTLDIAKQRLSQQPYMAQAEINKVHAMHRSVFVAGVRPFLLWVCGFGFLFAFVINPILEWLWPDVGSLVLPLDVMMELTLGMLGLAGLRTIEKIQGVAK